MPLWSVNRFLGVAGAVALALVLAACDPVTPASSPEPTASPSPGTPAPQASASPTGGSVEPVIIF